MNITVKNNTQNFILHLDSDTYNKVKDYKFFIISVCDLPEVFCADKDSNITRLVDHIYDSVKFNSICVNRDYLDLRKDNLLLRDRLSNIPVITINKNVVHDIINDMYYGICITEKFAGAIAKGRSEQAVLDKLKLGNTAYVTEIKQTKLTNSLRHSNKASSVDLETANVTI